MALQIKIEDTFLTPRDLLAFYPFKNKALDKRINKFLDDQNKWNDFQISGLIEKITMELKIKNADELFKKIVCRVIGVICETEINIALKGGGRKKKGGARREYNDEELHSIVSLLIKSPKNIIVFAMSVFIFVVGAYYVTLTANTPISYGTVSSSNNNDLSMKLEKAIVVYNDPAVNDKSIVIVNKPLFDDDDLSDEAKQKQQQSKITVSDLLYASVTWSGDEIVNNIMENTKELMKEKGQETINELVFDFEDQVKIGSYMKFIKNQGLENTDKPLSADFKTLKNDFFKKLAETSLVERIFHYYRFSFFGSATELMTIMNHDLKKFKNRAILKVQEQLDDALFNIQLQVSKVIKDGTTGFRMMGVSLMMMFGLYRTLKQERDRLNTKIQNDREMAELEDINKELDKKNQALENMKKKLFIALNSAETFIPGIITRNISDRTERMLLRDQDDNNTKGGGSKKRNRRRKRRKRTRRKSKKRKRKRKKTRRKRRR
tara:strand:- start:20326 stop:21801 length:1476 start_codon:yes stop_codon:yes gene_type:complete